MLTSIDTLPRSPVKIWGTITEIVPGMIELAGVSKLAGIGNEVRIEKSGEPVVGEILSVSANRATAMLFSGSSSVRVGDRVIIEAEACAQVSDDWLGKVIDFRGLVMGSRDAPAEGNAPRRQLMVPALPANTRRELGERLSTGLMITDTLLPLCRGQRMGLFAGSGVGKSTLLATLANKVSADRIVVALIGERSREVSEFANKKLSPDIRDKSVIVAATASDPPGSKKRAAYCAMAAAEYFRDQGHHVLLIFDSITRFAEAHREVALTAGETPALHAFPPSTVRAISELAERAGPGAGSMGDITAVYSVLVAGSDFEEPVSDMIRGIIDGHIVLTRQIAERGRYPAIDVLKSVSRALPNAASEEENNMLKEYRRLVAAYEDVLPMLRANLYQAGSDPVTDRAISLYSELDGFVSMLNEAGPAAAFEVLRAYLYGAPANPELESTEKEVLASNSANAGQQS